ncbi:MAG: toxin-antitoxin system HicB family antitoxin [Marmoricola sp.]
MDLAPYVDRLRTDLAQTAAAGDADVRAAAERLLTALDPALRLSLMEVLSEAAAEITSAMRAGGVEARLHGREIDFVLSAPAPAAPTSPPQDEDGDEGELARLTVRVPETIKIRAEELAAKGGQSLNNWIVGALRRATRDSAVDVDLDLSSMPFGGHDFPFGKHGGPRRMSGWV